MECLQKIKEVYKGQKLLNLESNGLNLFFIGCLSNEKIFKSLCRLGVRYFQNGSQGRLPKLQYSKWQLPKYANSQAEPSRRLG